jgi:hypothetical protein
MHQDSSAQKGKNILLGVRVKEISWKLQKRCRCRPGGQQRQLATKFHNSFCAERALVTGLTIHNTVYFPTMARGNFHDLLMQSVSHPSHDLDDEPLAFRFSDEILFISEMI